MKIDRLIRSRRRTLALEIAADASKKIMERVQLQSARLGLRCSRLTLSSARTRWGSCNSRGHIRINWRLALAPDEVLDYVVVHELIHLEVKNHSREFWVRVGVAMPDYKTHRRWLRENTKRLLQD